MKSGKMKSGGYTQSSNMAAKAKRPASGKNPNTNNITPTPSTMPEKALSSGRMGMGKDVAK